MVEDADADVVLLISQLTTSKQPSASQSESWHVLNDFMNKAFFLISFLRDFVGRFRSMGFERGGMPSPSIDRNFAKARIMPLGGDVAAAARGVFEAVDIHAAALSIFSSSSISASSLSANISYSI